MKSFKNNNLNPQKQSQVDILGYFNGPKLYKRQNFQSLLFSSQQKNMRKSPLQILKNQKGNQLKNVNPPLTARNAEFHQKNRNSQQSFYSGFYSSRNKKINRQDNPSNVSNKGVSLMKKQLNSAERKRFYYKQEYDQHDKNEYQLQQISEKSQYQTILPQYFSKINQRASRLRYDDIQEKSRNKEKRSLSPLQESQQKLFQKCYKETSSHLQLMLQEIYESKEKLDCIHEEILDNVYEAVKKKSLILRSQLIDMVEEILDQWQNNEWQFIKKNEILFLDDLLQLKEQLKERQIKVNQLMQKLDKQKSLNWLLKVNQRQANQSIHNSQTVWKSVTTDLLMFNYEHSILEIQELSKKISFSIPQKCEKAINALFSHEINQKVKSKSKNPSNYLQLKSIVTKIIKQINYFSQTQLSQHHIQSLKTPRNNSEIRYLLYQTKSRTYQY